MLLLDAAQPHLLEDPHPFVSLRLFLGCRVEHVCSGVGGVGSFFGSITDVSGLCLVCVCVCDSVCGVGVWGCAAMPACHALLYPAE